MIHNNVTVNAVGKSTPIYVGDAEQVTLLVYITGMTGTASITFNINAIEAISGKSVKVYAGTAITAADKTDYITVSMLTIGDYIEVEWTTTGTLSGAHYFTGCYSRLVVK
jgi:hypothetical protein